MKKMIILIAIISTVASCQTKFIPQNHGTSCSRTIDGTSYSLSPCGLKLTMIHGKGDQLFTFTITPNVKNKTYGYSVHGYGEGLPTYAILPVDSKVDWGGRATGPITLKFHFMDKELPVGIHKGYLPVYIFEGTENGGSTDYLKFEFELTVK